jgi:hypothetical protein
MKSNWSIALSNFIIVASTRIEKRESDESISSVVAASGIMKSKRVPAETQLHTGGTPTETGDKTPSVHADLPPLANDPVRLASLVKVAGSNAILAVPDFFEAHDIATLRASEVQFLMGLRDAIANGNKFRIESRYSCRHRWITLRSMQPWTANSCSAMA